LLGTLVLSTAPALADEGGVSFWIPGLYGSLAAVPQQTPGWSLVNIYYHTSVSAGSDVALEREFELRRIPANLSLSASLNGSIHANADLDMLNLNYAFATPVLGGQLTVGMIGAAAREATNLNGTLSSTLTTPIGVFPFMRTDSFGDSVTGFGDLIPLASLKWNQGVNNYMVYGTGDIPVGLYNSNSLANIGIGHGAADAGVGYTYLNPQTGYEFSAVAGFTYNLTNPATNYRNGLDFHLDMGASRYLSKQFFVGAVGYVYDQLVPDNGSAPILGPVKSRVFGVGPQLGFIFPVAGMQGYLNLKGYGEFDNHDRPAGWNTWLTFAISPAPPPAATPMSSKPMYTK
jgi:hypothetical protein